MATFMNESEIDEARERLQNRAIIGRYVIFLSQWRDIVNQNSDGWHSWPGGYRAAGKLITLIRQELANSRGFGWEEPINKLKAPTEANLNKALAPIKACATRKGLPCPVLRP